MCRVVGGSSKVARAEIHALSLEGDSDCALSFSLEPRSGCCIFLNTGTEGVFGDSECYLPILRAIPEKGVVTCSTTLRLARSALRDTMIHILSGILFHSASLPAPITDSSESIVASKKEKKN